MNSEFLELFLRLLAPSQDTSRKYSIQEKTLVQLLVASFSSRLGQNGTKLMENWNVAESLQLAGNHIIISLIEQLTLIRS